MRIPIKDYQKELAVKKATLEEYLLLRSLDKKRLISLLGITSAAMNYKLNGKKKDGAYVPGYYPMEKFTAGELAKINLILQIPKERKL